MLDPPLLSGAQALKNASTLPGQNYTPGALKKRVGAVGGTPKPKVGGHFSKKSKSGGALEKVPPPLPPHCPPLKYTPGGGGQDNMFKKVPIKKPGQETQNCHLYP